MTLEAIYFISQVIAAVALVVSLVFVGLQVRQGNLLAREATEQTQQANAIARTEFNRKQAEDVSSTYQAFATDPMFLRSMPRALADETEFSPEEWTQLYLFFSSLLQAATTAHMASKTGLLDDDYWPLIARGVCHLIVRPIFREHWMGLQRSKYQRPEFDAEINQLFRRMYPALPDPEYNAPAHSTPVDKEKAENITA